MLVRFIRPLNNPASVKHRHMSLSLLDSTADDADPTKFTRARAGVSIGGREVGGFRTVEMLLQLDSITKISFCPAFEEKQYVLKKFVVLATRY